MRERKGEGERNLKKPENFWGHVWPGSTKTWERKRKRGKEEGGENEVRKVRRQRGERGKRKGIPSIFPLSGMVVAMLKSARWAYLGKRRDEIKYQICGKK